MYQNVCIYIYRVYMRIHICTYIIAWHISAKYMYICAGYIYGGFIYVYIYIHINICGEYIFANLLIAMLYTYGTEYVPTVWYCVCISQCMFIYVWRTCMEICIHTYIYIYTYIRCLLPIVYWPTWVTADKQKERRSTLGLEEPPVSSFAGSCEFVSLGSYCGAAFALQGLAKGLRREQ